MKIEDWNRNENDPSEAFNETNIDQIVFEEKIDILCNGNYLNPTI